ncbi:hypothetical protein LJ737_07560 [Hymenobacter sp. 15J16-1T3B]|uniref:hypothetical protein n=1 Tax=Hymenobacter sp. 15J16-1T3B TaxID=2886941 RepID=UPI001D10E2F5|nr:hypothetical protein [Hymenobacter sp. 15J16-1T3B]MCC3157090.1 hypothetical protein [Hymenobacter sp. 15J16-1T3B]
MADFVINNRRFQIMGAGDVSNRDGAGWELWEYVDQQWVWLLEIFRHDDLRKIDFATFSPIDIPFEALERLLHSFNTTGGKRFQPLPEDIFPADPE